jgi:hypothetical protein
MSRKPSKPRKPKPPTPYANGLWTTPRFYSFVRSALRRAFTRWPPNYAARKDARQTYSGPNKRQQWQFKCALCGGWWMQKETQIDHKIECGSLRAFSDLSGFVERLFCEKDGLQVVCKKCHQEKTNLQRQLNKTNNEK